MQMQEKRSVTDMSLFFAPPAACCCDWDGAGEVWIAEETHWEHPGAAGGHQPQAG